MIAYIEGKIIEKRERELVVLAAGVGYLVRVGVGLAASARVGSEMSFKVHHHMSADNQSLFGFREQEELDNFRLLLTVPSVGPRTAMGILEVAPSKVLEQAVAQEDVVLLTKVSGVGKKTAQRILIELKEKIKEPTEMAASGSVQHEAVEALVSIGFTKGQAREAMKNVPNDVATTEEAVKAALQQQKS